MKKVQISTFQLYVLMFMYMLSPASVIFIAKEAKHDAWMATLIGGILGMLKIGLIITFIYKNNNNLSFPEILEKLVGKYISKILVILYTIYFIFKSLFLLRHTSELLTTYVLNTTPPLVLHIVEFSVVIYAVYKGLETISRTAEIYYFAVVFSYILFAVLLYFSDVLKMENILPMLENGFIPVLKSSVPLVLSFPYGDLIVFLSITHFVNKKEKVTKVSLLALLSTTLVLTLITVQNLMTVGPYLVENTPYPTMKSIRMIDVGDFLQRLDSIAVLSFLTCSFFKLMILQYAISTGLQTVFKTKKYQTFIIPSSVIIIIGSLYIAKNYTTHLYLAKHFLGTYFEIPFETIIPALLIIIALVKKFFKLGIKT